MVRHGYVRTRAQEPQCTCFLALDRFLWHGYARTRVQGSRSKRCVVRVDYSITVQYYLSVSNPNRRGDTPTSTLLGPRPRSLVVRGLLLGGLLWRSLFEVESGGMLCVVVSVVDF